MRSTDRDARRPRGAWVIGAGISRYAALMEIGSEFHVPDELARELADAGLREVEVYGVEGPAGATLRALGMTHLDTRLDAAVRAARMVERDPHLIAASGHPLAVGLA